MKDKMIAVLLCIFLGQFGAQRFYLGDTKEAIMILLGFWFIAVPVGTVLMFVGIGWIFYFAPLIDLIFILKMSDQEFADKYNNGQLKASKNPTNVNSADELEKLHDLKNKGVITDEEFKEKKSQLLK